MTIREAADRWHVSVLTLRKTLRLGMVPGAAKVPGPYGPEWSIPDDAVCPKVHEPKKRDANRSVLYIPGMSSREAFVADHCDLRSVRWIADALGVTTDEVRRIYDRILAMGGDDNGLARDI